MLAGCHRAHRRALDAVIRVSSPGEQGLRGDQVHRVDHPGRGAGGGHLLDDSHDLTWAAAGSSVGGGQPEAQQAALAQRGDRLSREACLAVYLHREWADGVHRDGGRGSSDHDRSSFMLRVVFNGSPMTSR